MINTIKFGFVILFALFLNACVMGGQMGSQMAAQNTYALQAAGPAGRVAALNTSGGRNTMFVPGAGDSIYANTGFDWRTQGPSYQRYLRDRPLIMTGGGRPPVIMVPGAGDIALSGSLDAAPTNNGGSNPGASASAGRVDRIARTVSRLSARQEEQGRVLQRIDHRLRRQPPPATPAPNPATPTTPTPDTPPAYEIDEWMVEAPR